MRILALTRYSPLGASSRVRFYQYAKYLKSQGVKLEVVPLLGDDYVRSLFTGKRPPVLSVMMAYLSRMLWLVKSRSFDLLWIEKELFPWFPAWGEKILSRLKVPYVVDYDDAVFHRYDLHSNPGIRLWLGRKIDSIMRHASMVVVGNSYLADRARLAGAARIEYLPSVVDTDLYAPEARTHSAFRLGWIGTPITAVNLEIIKPALDRICQHANVRLVLVGTGLEDPLPGISKEVLAWSEDTEIANIQSFDVGIMPLPDAPFERGKCGYKLIQYMACGLPVVASPVGMNNQIVESGKTGFLASTNAEWEQALTALQNDPGLRSTFGQAGRTRAVNQYSLGVTAPRLLRLLQSAIV